MSAMFRRMPRMLIPAALALAATGGCTFDAVVNATASQLEGAMIGLFDTLLTKLVYNFFEIPSSVSF